MISYLLTLFKFLSTPVVDTPTSDVEGNSANISIPYEHYEDIIILLLMIVGILLLVIFYLLFNKKKVNTEAKDRV